MLSTSASTQNRRQAMGKKSSKLFVGMDVHKDSIDVSLAEEGTLVRHYGRIGGDTVALIKTVRKLESLGKALVFVYEARPCGYALWVRDIPSAQGARP
jgi:hypothetical protein